MGPPVKLVNQRLKPGIGLGEIRAKDIVRHTLIPGHRFEPPMSSITRGKPEQLPLMHDMSKSGLTVGLLLNMRGYQFLFHQLKILLPGASGFEALKMFDTFLQQQGSNLLLVLDNAYRIPVGNLRNVLHATTCIHFVLLCQPHDNIRQLEAIIGL
ncbi:hypothetical protein M5G07_11980 [Serratia symbiotica]|nr:hypothetical protein [Serratia symbiotica]